MPRRSRQPATDQPPPTVDKALEAEATRRAAKTAENDADKITRLEARVKELEGVVGAVAKANQGAAAEFEFFGRELTRLASRAFATVSRPEAG